MSAQVFRDNVQLFWKTENLTAISLQGENELDETAVREKIRNFIVLELIRDEEYELSDSEGIISEGLMDSFALAEFGVFVEQEFDVYIPDSDLTVEKMDTLNQMVARVLRDI